MIDSHAHIIDEFFDSIDVLVDTIKSNDVKCVINSADNLDTTIEVLNYSKKYKNYLFPTCGIHPQNINKNINNDLIEIETLLKNNRFVAVGEIGLDYNYSKNNITEQKEVFIKQILLANKYNLPIVVHTRDSIQDTLNILKKYKSRGVIHCFSGSVEMAREFVKMGYYLGIGGVLTFKNSNLYKVIEKIDLDRLLLETDSPFLSPEPFRGKKNTPDNIKYVALRIAEIKNISFEEVIKKTTENAINVFDLEI